MHGFQVFTPAFAPSSCLKIRCKIYGCVGEWKNRLFAKQVRLTLHAGSSPAASAKQRPQMGRVKTLNGQVAPVRNRNFSQDGGAALGGNWS